GSLVLADELRHTLWLILVHAGFSGQALALEFLGDLVPPLHRGNAAARVVLPSKFGKGMATAGIGNRSAQRGTQFPATHARELSDRAGWDGWNGARENAG